MAELSPLRRRMIEDMTIRNLSPATQRSYVHAVAKFSRHFGRSPGRLGLEDVRAFQVHLVSTGISWPALNQTVCALRIFYGVTLGHAEIPERIVHARAPRTLPVVLSADEVVRFLEAVPCLKTRTALTTAYAAGLRASETVGLKVGDIDSERERGVIRVVAPRRGSAGPAPGSLRSCRRRQSPLARAGPLPEAERLRLMPGPGHAGSWVVLPVHRRCVRRSARLSPAFEHLDDDHASAAARAWLAEVVRLFRIAGALRRGDIQEFTR